jgi:AraC-like DNA-binding protein
MAKIAEVTPHHFASLFTKVTGLSPHQYVLRARIERAKIHLKDDKLSVAQVSRLIGFRTQEHFTKVFRKVVGVTPSKFREELANDASGDTRLA